MAARLSAVTVEAASRPTDLIDSTACCAGTRRLSATSEAAFVTCCAIGCTCFSSRSFACLASSRSLRLDWISDPANQPQPNAISPAASGLPCALLRAACGAELTASTALDAVEATASAAPDAVELTASAAPDTADVTVPAALDANA